MDKLIESLENDEIIVKDTAYAAPRFPCGQCAGSGFYQGARVHQEKAHCFACRGKGYFTTSPKDRQDASKSRADRRSKALATGIDDFRKAHPQMYDELRNIQNTLTDGNAFTCSLADQLFTRGGLSDRQIEAWYKGNERKREADLRREEETKAREANAPTVDLQPIRDMFEAAFTNGYKRPTYRAEGLVINRAPDNGSNPGALYVKTDQDEYQGKVVGIKYLAGRGAFDQVPELLAIIAADPLAAALRYGQRTGKCACCGRKLTKGVSIDLGIGPICKEKWNL